MNILKQKKDSLKVRVNTRDESIDDILSRLIKCGQVQDITIAEPPMEDIISHIYTRVKAGAGNEIIT